MRHLTEASPPPPPPNPSAPPPCPQPTTQPHQPFLAISLPSPLLLGPAVAPSPNKTPVVARHFERFVVPLPLQRSHGAVDGVGTSHRLAKLEKLHDRCWICPANACQHERRVATTLDRAP